jgi:4-hydroxy-2-oxoheptanedioate aldolase
VVGNAMATLGFQLITLAAESQALRRGAADILAEAAESQAPPAGPPSGGYQ